MVLNFVLVAGIVVPNLIGDPPVPRPAAQSDVRGVTAVAAFDPFNPPPKVRKRRRPRPPQTESPGQSQFTDEMDEEAPPPRRPAPAPPRRRPSPVETEPAESASQADDEEEERPKVRRKARKQVVVDEEEEGEEEEGSDEAATASLPVIMPRLISFQAAASTMGRSFQYNAPLQKETTFPRPGLTLAVESFPLLSMDKGWWNGLGLGFNLAMEFGAAALRQASGASVSFPVSQRRWTLDLRYAIPLGANVVLVPALGYGTNLFDLKALTQTAPSACNNGQTMPCLADVTASHLVADLHLRLAATSGFGVSLTGGYFVGLGVGKGTGQIGSERPATAMSGFHVELGATLMLLDWMAVRATVPFNRYTYSFSSGGAGAYSAATETYYGLTGGALIFLP